MGSVAFLVGMVIFLVSTILHPGREGPTNHPLVFAEYAEDQLWVASHISQFAGGMSLSIIDYEARRNHSSY